MNEMNQLRILQLNKYYAPHIGGIERVVQQIAEGLAEKTEMTVLVSAEDKKYHEEILHGVKLIRLPRQMKLGSMPVSFGLPGRLRRLAGQTDIIQLHMPFPLGDVACLLSGFKGSVIVWWHSDVVRQKKLLHFYKPVMLWMLRRADAIIIATEGHLEGSAYLKPFRDKCVIIPFGVEKKIEERADRYLSEQSDGKMGFSCREPIPTAWSNENCSVYRMQHPTQGSHWRKQSAAVGKDEPVRFLFVGRLIYYKGCDVLLKAFAAVHGAVLSIVGTGILETECRQIVQEYGIEDKVRFCGSLSEEALYQKYEECDVFVLPSIARSEAFGLVQIEAMSFGKPVINTRLPSGVPYVSLHGETGLTVEPGNVRELTEAMQWMVNHGEERRRMGQKARERMQAEYKMDIMLARILALYESCAGEEQKQKEKWK